MGRRRDVSCEYRRGRERERERERERALIPLFKEPTAKMDQGRWKGAFGYCWKGAGLPFAHDPRCHMRLGNEEAQPGGVFSATWRVRKK